jgi:hypothetical protein
MLSSSVYAEFHPRRAASHSRAFSNSFFFSPAFNDSTDQHPTNIQVPPKARHTRALLHRQHLAPLSPLAATLMDHPASVANKRLTANLTPLDATLTKNRGEGCTLSFTPFHQIPAAPVFSFTYKLPIFYPLCFDIHPCNGGVYPPSPEVSSPDVATFRGSDLWTFRRLPLRKPRRTLWSILTKP